MGSQKDRMVNLERLLLSSSAGGLARFCSVGAVGTLLAIRGLLRTGSLPYPEGNAIALWRKAVLHSETRFICRSR